jgi:site-specific DNA recombinase
MEFLDDGYSGATLVRPALERLRDAAVAGVLDRLYVHAPDRLARKYAYQVLLVEEFGRCGVEVVFLNRELGRSPEDDLLLQVQGMMAEYERAKIIERHRRGKLHAARLGSVNVLSGAPYGYRYVTKHDGGGQARMTSYLTRPAWSAKSLRGSAGTGFPLVKSVAGSCKQANGRARAASCGSGVWSGRC